MAADRLEPILVHLISGRSGSTLLMQLLGTSDDIAFDRTYPYENRYLAYLLHVLSPMGEAYDPERDLSPGEMLRRPSGRFGPLPFPAEMDRGELRSAIFRSSWRGFSDVVRDTRPSARFYAEKAAGDFSLLDRCGIPYRIVQLVRDPRDVFSSIQAFDEQRGFFGFGRSRDQSDDEYVDQWIDQVKRRVVEFEDQLSFRPQAVRLRYEDLVLDLSGVAARLARSFEVDLDAAAVEARREEFRHHMTSSDPTASVGQWQSRLPRRLRRHIERRLSSELRLLGY